MLYYAYQRGRVDTVARRLISYTTSLVGPGSIPVAGTVSQTVHRSGVSKLVATSRQLRDHCRILRSVNRANRKMAVVKTPLSEARTTSRRFPAVSHGQS